VEPLLNLNGRQVSLSEMKEREARYWAKFQKTRPDLEPQAMTPVAAKKLQLLLREKAYKHVEALKLYEPLPKQLAFHQCQSPERIILGGNRGSKTMATMAELAMAVTGQHRWLDYPKTDGRAICVAKDGIKIAEVFAAKLLKPGAFQMVKDKETGMYRAWRPWVDGWECKRTKALPLIPKRMIQAIAWEDKGLFQPKKITLTNGWEILFFTSAGRPMEGVDVDVSCFDEEIYESKTGGSWYDESSARLIDRNGRFFWSATPQAATEQLWKLHERAEEERNEAIPRVSEFHVTMDDNPFLPPAAKELFRHKASFDPDEYRVRVLGEFLITSHLVYPNFSKRKHVVEPFVVPREWARYLCLDPGYANVAALFFAVPPKNGPPHVYVYDEVYAHQCDAKGFVDKIYNKLQGHFFQAFIIDAHGSQRTEMSGKNIGQQYAEEMQKRGLRSIETGSGFIAMGGTGNEHSSPIKDGVSQVRSWLWDREDFAGTPKLQVFAICDQFITEMSKYKNKIDKGRATDIPDHKRYSHGPDALRYGVLHGMPYVVPKAGPDRKSNVLKYLEKKLRGKPRRDYVICGPSFSSTRR